MLLTVFVTQDFVEARCHEFIQPKEEGSAVYTACGLGRYALVLLKQDMTLLNSFSNNDHQFDSNCAGVNSCNGICRTVYP